MRYGCFYEWLGPEAPSDSVTLTISALQVVHKMAAEALHLNLSGLLTSLEG